MVFRTSEQRQSYDSAIVVDNSIMMRWLFKDGSTSDQKYARSVLQTIKAKDITVLVPSLWVYEAAFVTRHYIKQHVINDADACRQLDALFELSTVLRGQESPSALLEASQSLNISAHEVSESARDKSRRIRGVKSAWVKQRIRV